MSDSSHLDPQLLLRHEPFVRSVARALLRDEAGADDVVQQTWLTALRRAPDRADSLRAWLGRVARNLALDAKRGSGRRAVRERAAARDEATEAVDRAHERLHVQRDVVDAVLALEEPYRSVVLLRFFEGLDAAEVAARLDRSPATVRSQQSRALRQLRESLEGRYGAEDGAWALALALVLGGTPPPVSSTPSGGSAAASSAGVTLSPTVLVATTLSVCIAVLVGVSIWGAGGADAPTGEALALAEPRIDPPPVDSAAVAPDVERNVASSESTASSPDPESVAATAAMRRSEQDLARLREMRDRAVRTQRALRHVLFTADPAVVAANADWLSLPDTGVCRMIDRGSAEGFYDSLTGVRGGGAYYSFGSREHSYDAQPDLEVNQRKASSGFAGYELGFVVEIGDVPLAALSDDRRDVPPEVTDEGRELWNVVWGTITMEDAAHDSAMRSRWERNARRADIEYDTTYLVRSFVPDSHDRLTAFRVLAIEGAFYTIGWRTLFRWGTPHHRGGADDYRDSFADLSDGPEEWLTRSPESLQEQLRAVRDAAEPLLFEVDATQRARFEELVASGDAGFDASGGFARLLHHEEWHPLADRSNGGLSGGRYWSFTERSRRFEDGPDLRFDRGELNLADNRQLNSILDLGAIPFEDLAPVMRGGTPRDLDARTLEAWEFLHTVRADPERTDAWGRRELSEADAERAAALGFGPRGVPLTVGNSYLLRSMLSSRTDVLVVVTVLEADETGCGFAWRVLRSSPVPAAPR